VATANVGPRRDERRQHLAHGRLSFERWSAGFGSGASGDLELVWMDRSGKISTIATSSLICRARSFPARRPRRSSDETPSDRYLGARSDPWSPHQSHLWTVGNVSPICRPTANGSHTPLPKTVTLHLPQALRRQRRGRVFAQPMSSSPGSTIGSHDGKYLLYSLPVRAAPFGKSCLALQESAKPSLGRERVRRKTFSRRHWLATSRPSPGRSEVYAMPLLAAGRASGRSPPMEDNKPRWSKDGKRIY